MTVSRIRIATMLSAIAVGASLIGACTTGTSTESAGSSVAATSAGEHAGHGGGTVAPSSNAVAAQFNDADVEFATMMYPHHAQAVEMAKLVDGKGARPEVVALAAEVQGAQQPEMDAFTRLLAQWGKPAPSASMAHTMDGMMTPAQMEKLGTLRGAEFDREWLTMMITHHKGAITMADTELEKGVNPENRKIAEQIKSGQQAEIARMEKLLA
ncbi:DUF305 domain-containing protein [Tsukamurella ocularis]|uniref:DUF305 domain-containing protein n=1 Tax=Tsukamurella ocularis TaxID=1970234 RepID=UPI00216930B7|nr:DUF305 domain-containing protein [Tsukamurella ocularis]MCS3779700.1 uncharacterized protein (DUF305 family) [Tsukamurella ocularis]MCS3788900.1 uncharacterized protein (DUF305 family) [Tsukamurella ocularis]MCS3850110.1 uncharacterized protein (DUF305 family) [Tsukamurella ocularis]